MFFTETVNLLDDNFDVHTFTPGMVLPDWAQERVDAAFLTDVDPNQVDEPTVFDVETAKKADLVEFLEAAGLPAEGKVDELRERARTHIEGGVPVVAADFDPWEAAETAVVEKARELGLIDGEVPAVEELRALVADKLGVD